jgi:hypothetical protein
VVTEACVCAGKTLTAECAGALTARQIVDLYLVLAPLPGGRWLRQLTRRHPEHAPTLSAGAQLWARVGSKERVQVLLAQRGACQPGSRAP